MNVSEKKNMYKNKINIHITDDDFNLENNVVYDTEIRATGSAFGRFIFTEHPYISIRNNHFIRSRIDIGGSGGSILDGNVFSGNDISEMPVLSLNLSRNSHISNNIFKGFGVGEKRKFEC